MTKILKIQQYNNEVQKYDDLSNFAKDNRTWTIELENEIKKGVNVLRVKYNLNEYK